MTRSLTVLAVVALGCSSLIVACRDDTTVAPLHKGVVDNGAAVRYAAAELHARNPFDWVGQLHNKALRDAALELRKPNIFAKDLCGRMKAWLMNSENLGQANRDSRFTREAAVQGLQRSPLCTPPTKLASAFRQVAWVNVAQSETPSAAAEALYAQIEDEVSSASDPNDLAYRLSPIATEAEQLTSYDYTYVSEGIAIGQASFEHWYDENNFDALYDPIADELDLCFSGQYENGSYESEGVTYICQDSEWRQASFRNHGSLPEFRRVAAVRCNGGDGVRWGWLGAGDVGGFKAGHWFSVRFDPAHSLAWAVGGALGGSVSFAVAEGYRLYQCGRAH